MITNEQRVLWTEMATKREQVLDSVIRDVLIQENALEWIVTPARLFVSKVRKAGNSLFDVYHSDDYIKSRINAVSREMRKEMRMQRKQLALQA